MLGRVGIHISEEDEDYIVYVKEVLNRLRINPHFIYMEEEQLFGEVFSFLSRPSEEKRLVISRQVEDLFGSCELQTYSGRGSQTLLELQDNYDFIFLKYSRHIFRTSIPEWIIKEDQNLKLWVYKKGKTASIKRVCIPVDFSERSLSQVEFADQLRRVFNFDYDLVYSVNVGRFKDKLEKKHYNRSLLDKKEEAMHMFTDTFGNRELSLKILEGDPYRDMVRFINSSDYDLVIIGRRGRGMRRQIGSVSLYMVRSVQCPVVVL